MSQAKECVILLHGLARGEGSFTLLQGVLDRVGYRTIAANYPSREKTIPELVQDTIPQAVAGCGDSKVHFVTHSMGGILLRSYLAVNDLENLCSGLID